MELDINNVICVNLRKGETNRRLSPARIRFIADYFELSAEVLTRLSEKYCKVWIATKFEGGAAVIYAADSIGSYVNYQLFAPFDKLAREVRVAILEIPVTPVPPTPKQQKKVKEKPIILDIDVILDKIGKSGMSSLTTTELDYLNEQSNLI